MVLGFSQGPPAGCPCCGDVAANAQALQALAEASRLHAGVVQWLSNLGQVTGLLSRGALAGLGIEKSMPGAPKVNQHSSVLGDLREFITSEVSFWRDGKSTDAHAPQVGDSHDIQATVMQQYEDGPQLQRPPVRSTAVPGQMAQQKRLSMQHRQSHPLPGIPEGTGSSSDSMFVPDQSVPSPNSLQGVACSHVSQSQRLPGVWAHNFEVDGNHRSHEAQPSPWAPPNLMGTNAPREPQLGMWFWPMRHCCTVQKAGDHHRPRPGHPFSGRSERWMPDNFRAHTDRCEVPSNIPRQQIVHM